jgi:integrase
MAVYRETYTKPLPPGAELFTRAGERFARWTDRHGRKRAAKVITGRDGSDRLTLACTTHTARYRDGSGVVRKAATGCRTKDAAETVLSDLRGRAELVKAKVLTAAQDAAADHAAVPIAEHFDAYRDHLTAKGATASHWKTTVSRLRRLAEDCRFGTLADLSAGPLDKWLVLRTAEGMSASTRNAYRESLVSFGNWCVSTDRLVFNPCGKVPKADEKADPRRQRRALTEDELLRLLTVARLRPLADFGRATQKTAANTDNPKRANWTRAPLTFDDLTEAADRGRAKLSKRPDFSAELEHRGRERALIYKALLLTGLRKGELASLTVGQLDLDAPQPYAVLNAADEKNRHGSDIPLRADLAADLRAFLGDRLKALQDAARLRIGEPVPMRLPPSAPVFNVPAGLVRILDRDLAAAGIAKRDERGRTVDVHAMRHTFGTHLSKGGVTLRTAQAAMRHSSPTLTANVYTDPKLLDVAGALNALPALPLDAEPQADRQKATGTAGTYQEPARPLVLGLVRAGGKPGHPPSLSDNKQTFPLHNPERRRNAKNPGFVQEKTPLTSAVNGVQQVGVTRFELATSWSRTKRSKPS